jgi:hypothetical protein
VTLEGEVGVVRPFASETRESGDDRRNAITQAFTVGALLRDVPPGRYLLRVRAQSDAHKTTTERAVPIEVRMADAIESQG